MSIEDIKGKLHNYEHFYAGDSEEAYKDMTYLLSIIERQEKALCDAKEALDNQYRFNGGVIENNKAYMAIFNGLTILKL